MANNKAGGIKASQTILKTRPNFYKEIGSKGGQVKNPNKGFGSNRQLASKAGILGGSRSKRGPASKASK